MRFGICSRRIFQDCGVQILLQMPREPLNRIVRRLPSLERISPLREQICRHHLQIAQKSRENDRRLFMVRRPLPYQM
jgi:hypothetical protein